MENYPKSPVSMKLRVFFGVLFFAGMISLLLFAYTQHIEADSNSIEKRSDGIVVITNDDGSKKFLATVSDGVSNSDKLVLSKP